VDINSILSSEKAPLPPGGLRGLLKSLGSPDKYGNPPLPITGEIKVFGPQRNGSIYLKNGKVYGAQLDSFTPPIALRLLSTGLLSDDMFQTLYKLKPDQVGATAVALGFVEEDIVEDINRQILFSTLTHMYEWRDAHWLWIKGNYTQNYTITPLDTSLTISATDERLAQWFALVQNHKPVTQGSSTVFPGPSWINKVGEETTPEISSILAHVDGENTVAQIAAACGFARFEIASRLAKAIADELIIVKARVDESHDYGNMESLLHDKQQELEEAEEMVARLSESLIEAQERLANAKASLGLT
jgi:hypothetical protein